MALGSVAAKPWRVEEAESLLTDTVLFQALFTAVADRMVSGARTYTMNGYKVPLDHALVVRGLMETAGLEPLAGPAGAAFARECQRNRRRAGGGMMASEKRTLTLSVNGKEHALRPDPRTTVLDALHEQIGLTGTKKGCDHGQCGACTIHVDGERILSCLLLVESVTDRAITTMEGIAAANGMLHRCSRHSSIATRSSAATARPARSCPPSRA